MNTGVYQIKNSITDMVYIGSSANIKNRTRKHFLDLEKGKHDNKYLQNSYDKHGANNFSVKTLLVCDVKDLLAYEQLIIDGLQACNRETGYNLCPIAGSTRNKPVSSDTRIKMSVAGKAKKLTDEHKEKIRCSLLGNKRSLGTKHSEERKKEISDFFKGRKHSKETIEKMNAGRAAARLMKIEAVT